MKAYSGWPRLRRRGLHRLAAGAAALAGLGPTFAPATTVQADPPVAASVTATGADAFGLNEAFRAMPFGAASGAGWTRWTVQWFNVQPQAGGPLNEHYFRDEHGQSILEAQVKAGLKVTAIVLGTPDWAAATPGLKPGTAVPAGLYEPVFVGGKINPANTFGAFMFALADRYKGLLDVFEIWNEVEIPATGSNALYNTFAGSAADYFQLLAVASQAAKTANPNALIVTAPYSYFKDRDSGQGGSLPWFDAFAALVREGGADVFDVFALNLYRNPHDLWDRLRGGVAVAEELADRIGFQERLARMGAAGRRIWLTEINAMPYDDEVHGWRPSARNDGFRITLDEQASYVIQAYALALAAGYERVFFQALQDDPYPVPDELWGLVRFHPDRYNADPSRLRPAYTAYQLAARYLGHAGAIRLFVKKRPDPKSYRRYASRFEWAGHLVVADTGTQRASILWNGTDTPMTVTLPSMASAAVVVDKYGNQTPIPSIGGTYALTLDPASRHFDLFGGDPPGYYYIGGSPLILVEDVPPGAPVLRPAGFVEA